MREIRFRAWDKEEERMSYQEESWLIDCEYSSLCFPFPSSMDTGEGDKYELMQFTGLKDKRGKEIYEGDILSWQTEDGSEVEKSVIYWDESEAFFDGAPNGWSCTNFYLVIGNIYENQELIK